MDLGLKNRTALVCGSSKGIGKTIALFLAKEGVNIALCSRNANALEETRQTLVAETGVNVIGIVADLSSRQDIEKILQTTQKQLGAIDILINNTGTPPAGNLLELTEENWESAYQMMLMRVIRLTKGVIPQMKEKNWGRIVNIEATSIAQPRDDFLLSSTLRAGVAAFSQAIAANLATHNILIHTVCPGVIATESTLAIADKVATAEGISRETARKRLINSVPMERMGTPEEIAALVTCLVSDRLSYITGHLFNVDGGRHRVFPNSPYAKTSQNQTTD
ncbi:MAG: SDR family oxidoreductase [Microcoleaceae cyanobacterium]